MISLFNIRNNTFPRGLLSTVCDILKETNVTYSIEGSEYLNLEPFADVGAWVRGLGIPFEVDDFQVEALRLLIEKNRYVAVSPTGSGKSLITYLFVRFLIEVANKRHVLVIVPRKALCEQLYNDFATYANKEWRDKNIIRIHGEVDKLDLGEMLEAPCIISTYQSLDAMLTTQSKKLLAGVDALVVDECHKISSGQVIENLSKLCISAYTRVGLTATLHKTKVHKLQLQGVIGEAIEIENTQNLIARNRLAKPKIISVILHHKTTPCKKALEYPDEVKLLESSRYRNSYIATLAADMKGNTLILTSHLEHLSDIHAAIKQIKSDDVYVIDATTPIDKRAAIADRCSADSNVIILATYGTMSTGVNIVYLHNGIFAMPLKSHITMLQSLGRMLRATSDKQTCLIADISDQLYNSRGNKRKTYSAEHLAYRLESYADQGHFCKTFNIDI